MYVANVTLCLAGLHSTTTLSGTTAPPTAPSSRSTTTRSSLLDAASLWLASGSERPPWRPLPCAPLCTLLACFARTPSHCVTARQSRGGRRCFSQGARANRKVRHDSLNPIGGRRPSVLARASNAHLHPRVPVRVLVRVHGCCLRLLGFICWVCVCAV